MCMDKYWLFCFMKMISWREENWTGIRWMMMRMFEEVFETERKNYFSRFLLSFFCLTYQNFHWNVDWNSEHVHDRGKFMEAQVLYTSKSEDNSNEFTFSVLFEPLMFLRYLCSACLGIAGNAGRISRWAIILFSNLSCVFERRSI